MKTLAIILIFAIIFIAGCFFRIQNDMLKIEYGSGSTFPVLDYSPACGSTK